MLIIAPKNRACQVAMPIQKYLSLNEHDLTKALKIADVNITKVVRVISKRYKLIQTLCIRASYLHERHFSLNTFSHFRCKFHKRAWVGQNRWPKSVSDRYLQEDEHCHGSQP
jgi:hypothetical protein